MPAKSNHKQEGRRGDAGEKELRERWHGKGREREGHGKSQSFLKVGAYDTIPTDSTSEYMAVSAVVLCMINVHRSVMLTQTTLLRRPVIPTAAEPQASL